jgi:uncharacterized protein YjiS (DUF1127 family)
MFKSRAATQTGPAILPGFARSLLARISEFRQRNRALGQLGELSDAHLKDIGIERREIGSVVERELQRLRRSDLSWQK